MSMLTDNQTQKIGRVQRQALVVGVGASGIALAGGIAWAMLGGGVEKAFQPFIVGFLLWFGLGVSSLALIMLHHLCGGAWSFMIQRIAEAASRTLFNFWWIAALLILGGSVLMGVYPWTHDNLPHIVQEKTAFLNPAVWFLCGFIYFALWIGMTMFYNKWSRDLDETGDQRIISKMKFFAAPGLIIYVLSMTFAATHWVMSFEPEWFSTIYGMWLISGYALSTLCFCLLVISYLMDEPPISEKVTVRQIHHIGTFMFGVMIFWTYASFSQFLLIWNANLPEEIGFYLHRGGTAMNLFTVILILSHWIVPMFLMIIRKNKENIRVLRKIAIYMLAVRFLDIYWNVIPSFEGNQGQLNIFTLVLCVFGALGVGGLWLVVFLNELKKRPLLPLHDPRAELSFLKDQHSHA